MTRTTADNASTPFPVAKVPRSRYVLFPIQYPEIWKAYKVAQSSFWTADEIDLRTDCEQWRSALTDDERKFLSVILGFFAASDGIVAENLVQRFAAEIDIQEVKCFYGYQVMIENVHAELYSRFIQELVQDPTQQDSLFSAIECMPAVKAKADWCIQWINTTQSPLPVRLIAFAIVEGIFFSSSFAALFWLRQRNLMPALTYSNELIARDEGQHTNFSCLLYSMLHSPVPESTIHTMMREAVDLEHNFFDSALPHALPGMTATRMRNYVEYMADFMLEQLGCSVIYNKANPFPFMERTAIDAKTNFFERRVSEYHGSTISRV